MLQENESIFARELAAGMVRVVEDKDGRKELQAFVGTGVRDLYPRIDLKTGIAKPEGMDGYLQFSEAFVRDARKAMKEIQVFPAEQRQVEPQPQLQPQVTLEAA